MQENEAKADGEAEVPALEPSQPTKDWPAKCVEEAQKTRPVPAAVSKTVTEQLAGIAAERSLRATELAALSLKLLAALDEPPAKEPAP